MTTSESAVEGRLEIHLAPARGEVEIRSTRPLAASRIFEGRKIDDALPLLPLLFNICGQAQAAAAVRAVESATGERAADDVERARERLIALETLREHLWRVLLDWPRFCGDKPAMQQLAPLMGLLQATRQAVDPGSTVFTQPGLRQRNAAGDDESANWQMIAQHIGRQVFAQDPAAWLMHDLSAHDAWLRHCDTPASRMLRFVRRRDWGSIGPTRRPMLPALDNSELRARLDADDADAFIAAPSLGSDSGYETGALARQAAHPLIDALRAEYGNALYPRLVARLLEIAQIAVHGGTSTAAIPTVTASDGVAQVEAARGRLVHRVVLDDTRIARYRILAPTEWNFGPMGPATEALRGIVQGETSIAREQAELLIHAIDPCVGYTLDVEGS
ncbi:MAG: nickel-dependent hydrogenase large subunit [Gammaproteobacteria bacterium]|nr:nickel-dependent hydrogenase large subunit [Gammaproteobacteria bacterium]